MAAPVTISMWSWMWVTKPAVTLPSIVPASPYGPSSAVLSISPTDSTVTSFVLAGMPRFVS
jgi:hypothetical protein